MEIQYNSLYRVRAILPIIISETVPHIVGLVVEIGKTNLKFAMIKILP